MPEFKVKPKRFPSDGCFVTVDGVQVAVHAGEWVEMLPITSVGEVLSLSALTEGDLKDGAKVRDILMRRVDQLARRVTAWNWTDWAGQPLPQPYGCPEAFGLLSSEEIAYLVGLTISGETGAERKNG